MRARNYLLILGKSEKSMVFVCVLERREREREREKLPKKCSKMPKILLLFSQFWGVWGIYKVFVSL